MTANVGKGMRLKRVIDPDGVSVICALDHGMTSPTFLEPLADIGARTREAVAGGANVIMMSKGMIRVAQEAFGPTTSLALLLSASAGPGGDRPEIVQIAVHTEAASEQVSLDLDLAVGDPVVILERVRTADGRPVVFSRDIVSTRRVSSSEVARMPVDGSLYDVLEHLGYAVANGVVTIEPTVTDRTLARLLKGKVGVPILFLRQVDFDQNGDPVLLSEEHHLAEAFEFTVVRRGPGRRAS